MNRKQRLNTVLTAGVLTFLLTLMFATIVQASEENETICMAKNMYWEAGNQSLEGKQAVAWVVLRRAESDSFPDGLCDVVYQNNHPDKLHKCHFSWTCDKIDNEPTDMDNYIKSAQIASDVMSGRVHYDPSMGADHYIRCDKENPPEWVYRMEQVAKIDDHCFYDSNKAIDMVAKQ